MQTTHSQNSGAAVFTDFVKGAGLSTDRNRQSEKRIEGKNTRTLDHHKGAAPKAEKRHRPSDVERLVACKLTLCRKSLRNRWCRIVRRLVHGMFLLRYYE